jgi:hypothetical protein
VHARRRKPRRQPARPAGLEVRGRGTAVRSEEAEQGPPTVAVEAEQGLPVPAPVEVKQEPLMSVAASPVPPPGALLPTFLRHRPPPPPSDNDLPPPHPPDVVLCASTRPIGTVGRSRASGWPSTKN